VMTARGLVGPVEIGGERDPKLCPPPPTTTRVGLLLLGDPGLGPFPSLVFKGLNDDILTDGVTTPSLETGGGGRMRSSRSRS